MSARTRLVLGVIVIQIARGFYAGGGIRNNTNRSG